MGLRRRSIRLRIFVLVLIPILCLTGVYAFAATITASNAIKLSHEKRVYNTISLPSGSLESALDAERVYAAVYLADPAPINLGLLQAQEHKTDQAVATFKAAAAAAVGSESVAEKQAFATMLAEVATLPALRAQIASHAISRPRVINVYGNMINQDGILEEQIILQQDDVSIAASSLTLNRTGNIVNLLLQEEALLLGDSLARSFSAADRQEFTELVGARQVMNAEVLSDFDPTLRAIYEKDLNPRVMAPLEAMEARVIGDTHPSRVPPVNPITWSSAVQQVSLAYGVASKQAAVVVTARAQPQANSTFLQLYLVGGLGLLAIILSIILSVWIGRGLVQQLGELRRSALDLANKRLPTVVERLRAGQDVDVSVEAPPLESSGDEIGQVTEAFNAVQRTAVEVAVDEARLRRGVSDVFRNLARRSQSLLHRQLALLDAMERRASEPEELEDLFRIDHLTTRMRRHSEGLIILSGESPGRGWRHPVPFVDVLRAAVAEVEDYTRIRVTTGARVALIGPAVADVIHMVAELAENATIFSPPNAPVRIHGDVVGRGYAIEIEDRGLGIAEQKLAEINQNFAHPPQFDLSGSEQLGLFVAGQLARRHDIRITLQPSPFGGTTAIVLIPKALVVEEGAYEVQASMAAAGDRAIRMPSRRTSLSQVPEQAALGQLSALTSAEALPSASADLPPSPVAGLPAGNAAEPPAAPTRSAPTPAATVPPAATPAAQADSVFTPRHPRATPSPTGSFFAFGNSNDQRRDPPPSPPLSPSGSPEVSQQRVSAAELNELGLPVRVRRASLAPQLRDTGARAADADDSVPNAPSPEAARSTMTALQRGWERGRYISGTVTPSSETTLSPDNSGNGGDQRDDE